MKDIIHLHYGKCRISGDETNLDTESRDILASFDCLLQVPPTLILNYQNKICLDMKGSLINSSLLDSVAPHPDITHSFPVGKVSSGRHTVFTKRVSFAQ